MALVPVQVRVVFDRGVDTKNDPLTLTPGALLSLENARFSRLGSIDKREGFAPVTSSQQVLGNVPTTLPLSTLQGLEALGNGLVLLGSGSAYVFGESANYWIPRGTSSRLSLAHRSVVYKNSDLSCGDSAVAVGVQLFVWADASSRSVYASAVDVSSSLAYISDVLLSPSGSAPRALAFADRLYAFWQEQNGSSSTVIKCAAMGAGSSPVTIRPMLFQVPQVVASDARPTTTGSSANSVYDVCAASGGNLALLLYATGSYTDTRVNPRGSKLVYLDRQLHRANDAGNTDPFMYLEPVVQSSSILPGFSGSGITLLSVSARASDGAVFVVQAGHDGSRGPTSNGIVTSWMYDAHLTATFSDKGCVGLSGSLLKKPVALAGIANASGNLEVYASGIDESVPYQHAVSTYTCTVDATGSTIDSAPSLVAAGVCLASKPWTYAAQTYLGAVFNSTVQPTYFVYGRDGRLHGRLMAGQAGGLDGFRGGVVPLSGTLPLVSSLSSSSFSWPVMRKGTLESDGGTVFAPRGISVVSMSFDGATSTRMVPMSDVLVRGGATVDYFDGNSFTEWGSHLYPDVGSSSVSFTSQPLTGTYLYCYVYEWRDDVGQVSRSAPSVPVRVAVNSGTVTHYIPSLRQTMRPFQVNTVAPALVGFVLTGSRNRTSVGVFRTVANDAADDPVFYRVNTTSSLFCEPTATTCSIDDGLPDSSLVGNELLYTVGGVLQNDPPPAAQLVAVTKNRVFLAGLEDDPLAIAFSKERVPGELPSFSDSFRIRVDPYGGPITALSAMDDRVVVFKRRAVFTFAGEGPDDLGDGPFDQAQLASLDVGCANPDSVVLVRDGLMFESEKGIHLLRFNGAVEYVGAPVEAYNGLTIVSAEALPDRNQARFLTREGTTLVYDWYVGQWSTDTGQAGLAGTVRADGRYCFLSASGLVHQSSGSYYSDGASTYQQSVETGWIRPTESLQRPWRLWKVTLVGQWHGPHLLEVSAAYDNNPAYVQSASFDPAASGATTTGSLYQFQFYPVRQQCQGIRLRVRDLASGSSALGNSFTLNEAVFWAGVDGSAPGVQDAAKRG